MIQIQIQPRGPLIQAHIRWFIRRDLLEVCEIERLSFDVNVWSADCFVAELRPRNQIGMVAEVADRVVGFMLYRLAERSLAILNFAVHPQFRRLGVGGQMVAKLVGKLSNHRRTRITLMVRESNLHAQLFFRSQGFRAVKILPNHYEDSGESAYLMRYHIAKNELEKP